MLTQSEREWLGNRKHKAYCRYCNVSELCANPFASGYSCPLIGNMKDAAEFSERVAAKLALGCESKTPCHGCWRTHWKLCNLRKGYWDCADCFLKAARLQIEEEMDEQSQD